MANQDSALGYRAVTGDAGTTPQQHEYSVAASTSIFQGQIVGLNASGLVVAYAANTTDDKRVLGGAVHERKSADVSRLIKVYDHPNQEYEVQVDDNSITNDGDLIARNFSATLLASGTVATGQCISELDGNTGSAVNTATTRRPFKGVRFSKGIQNDNASSFNKVVVKINSRNHIFAAENTGV